LCGRRAGGFTLVELVVVLVVVSVLAAVAVERLFYYQERAEKVAMLANLEAFRMGLRVQVAELMTTNRADRIGTLEGANPISWMEQAPPGWMGEYRAPPPPGSWSYATATHELVYMPQNDRYLRANGKDLRFKVVLRYAPNGAGGQALAWATLAPVAPYQWF
jgi:general secretion pathway protein G